ncbi:aromatic-ring-hydroxylating dioxygenase subunit beta [Amphritea sp. HPY]|uniref:aromatic-ring-hydroxylating dioxygenase subunit beta n=1 Tax=Amphritea sp. HPY TaxID=3421652 RepID=UPI003D7C92B6
MNLEQLVKDKDTQALSVLVTHFNNEYARVLDDGTLTDWPSFFTSDAFYIVTGRENYENDLPVGLIYCEGRAMMRDRAVAIAHTAMFAPRYLRHFITNTFVEKIEGGEITASANYMLMQTLHDKPETTTHQVGQYIDTFVVEAGELKLKKRACVYDDLQLDNSLVYPV